MATIEFAILAPVLIALICGSVDLGYVYLAQISLTGAVARAARNNVATQESTQAQRDQSMRAMINSTMSPYVMEPGGQLTITSKVYDGFAAARPEDYTDLNHNGQYDAPSETYVGDPFTDRNANGRWDPDAPVAGTTGGVGQVVRITATYPLKHPFGFLTQAIWGQPSIKLSATSVARNEIAKNQ